MAQTTTERPTRSKRDKKQKNEPLRTGVRICVADLRPGDRIVTRWHSPKIDDMTSDQVDQAIGAFAQGESRFVSQSKLVETIDECRGAWRTHIHVNRSDCYDIRQFVWTVLSE